MVTTNMKDELHSYIHELHRYTSDAQAVLRHRAEGSCAFAWIHKDKVPQRAYEEEAKYNKHGPRVMKSKPGHRTVGP